ncbi:hypothetical protein CRG98_001386, partial [Punica granatum]
MGACFSDVKGGMQAVGGTRYPPYGGGGSSSIIGGPNDAVDMFYRARCQQALCTPLELSMSASKLRDRDILSKSDPMAVVYLKKRDGRLEELGRTEVVLNSLDPAWIQKVSVSYQFEMVQNLVIHVYDVDTKYHNLPVKALNLKDQEFLGEATCVLSEIVTQRNCSLTINLQNKHGQVGPRNLGTLTVHAEEPVASKTVVNITFRCTNLDNKDLFSKSENPLEIECFDFDSDGSHQFMGTLKKSIADLEKLHRDRTGANFVLPASLNRGREKVLKGQLFVEQFSEKPQFSFLDYISSGFELNFMVAVDFTASNGNPRSPDSLHYIDPSRRLNSYQQAIMDVGEVLQFYDSDRRFPAWGFGGRTYDGSVSHCFNLSPSGHE